MMNLAEAWGLRPDRSNPCYHIRKYKENKRERFLTPEELAGLGKALDEEESFAPAAVTAFRLLLYTGARLSEIQTLKWEHIRGDRIHLQVSKTGPRTVWLSQAAQAILARQPRDTSPYVFPSPRHPDKPLSDTLHLWSRARKEAGLDDVRLHDLRHTVASQAVARGVPCPPSLACSATPTPG